MDFRRFKNIIITSNFNRDITRITSLATTSFKNDYKSNRNSYAEVLTIPKDDDFELYLVIKSDFARNITKRHDKQEYKDAIHVIHHELAHIHDNNKKIDVFKELMKTSKYKGISSITYPLAESCWSEYIANFISSQSAIDTKYPKMIAETLIEKIEIAQRDIKTSLLAYKINNKRDDLIETSILQIDSILKSASYLLGYLNGMKITLAEIDDEIDLKIETSYFKDFWEIFKHEIASIHQLYPHGFVNLNIYKNLASYIEIFYSQMGLVLDEDEKGRLKIHIM